jgi:hypothetical protein
MGIDDDVFEVRVLVDDVVDPFGLWEALCGGTDVLESSRIFVLTNAEDDVSVGAPRCVGEGKDMLQEFS